MSSYTRATQTLGSVFFSLILSLVSITSLHANAGLIVQCGGDDTCVVPFTVQMSVDGGGMTINGNGELLYDAETGDISLNTDASSTDGVLANNALAWTMPNGNSLSVNSLNGNADPILGFGVGASTSNFGGSFSFNFQLPIAIGGTIQAESSLGYSLTALTSAGAQITPLGSDLLQAFDVDTTPLGLGSLNKGVDTGSTFGFLGETTQTTSFGETNIFTGSTAYDLMTVTLDFALSPNSIAGITGFVEQTVVPVPAAAWLMGSALLGLSIVKRRRNV